MIMRCENETNPPGILNGKTRARKTEIKSDANV